jgi:hypothetical protein
MLRWGLGDQTKPGAALKRQNTDQGRRGGNF